MTGAIWGGVAFVGLIFGLLIAALRVGARKERAATDAAQAKSYETTMEAAIDAPVHSDPAAARERMRTRDPRKP